MIPLYYQNFVQYWLLVRGDHEFDPGVMPPSFEEARRLLSRFTSDDLARRRMRIVLASDFGCFDLFRYDDHQVLDILAQHVAAGRAQIYREEMERSALSSALPKKAPEKRKEAQAKEETTWIEVLLVDEQDNPVPGVRYEIYRAKGTPVSSGALDSQGLARVTGIKAGQYKVGFPALDREFWCPSALGSRDPRKVASEHIVQQGECIESIAFQHGLFWQTVWDHPKNRELRERCKAPSVLAPGDSVSIPEKLQHWETGESGRRHQFRLKGVPFKVQLRLLDDDGRPRTGVSYVLKFPDGTAVRGAVPSDGWIKHHVPPQAKTAQLDVLADTGTEQYVLTLANLDPIYEATGIQQRLRNLGYMVEEPTGELDMATELALWEFQIAHGLSPSGGADEKTLEKLLDLHGC